MTKKELINKMKEYTVLYIEDEPGMNGIDFATLIRTTDSDTRIIMTTAYTNKEFMLQAVELDLTRYLVKPVTGTDLFSALEKAMIELKNSTITSINLGEGYIYQLDEKNILKNKRVITLRKKEIDLLEFFINKKNQTITYEVIETQIWPNDVMTEDAIRSQIRNIRNKTYSKIFKNISGVGYKFCEVG